MKKFWSEFREFAGGGNLLDLALGFIIGAAFAAVVESLAKNVIMDLIAALGGSPDMTKLTIHLGKGRIHYGTFLGDLLSFVIMALVLFGLVKLIIRFGLGNFRAQGQKECAFCKEFVAIDALTCKWCTQALVVPLPTLAEAEEL